MADTGFISASSDILRAIGNIGLWLQALGVIIVLWIIFQIVSFLMNRKRMAEVYKIKEDMVRIENKIDYIKRAVRKGKN